jgi:esterase/lipase
MIRELILGQDPKSYASHCRAIVDMKDPGFGSIKAPVLILAGDEDKSAPLDGCQYIYDHLGSQHKELKVMQGVGHWHCVEAGEDVGKAISAFAAQIA